MMLKQWNIKYSQTGMELFQTIHMPHVMLLNNAYVLVQKQHLLAKENATWLQFSLGISNLTEILVR